jgi:hypothetical protein
LVSAWFDAAFPPGAPEFDSPPSQAGAGATDAWADGGAADSTPPACDDDELHPTRRPALTSCPLIEIHGEDELALIVASVRVDDEFAVALTCRALHAAALGARQA